MWQRQRVIGVALLWAAFSALGACSSETDGGSSSAPPEGERAPPIGGEDQGPERSDADLPSGPRSIEPPPSEGALPTPQPTALSVPASISAPARDFALSDAPCGAHLFSEIRGWVLDETGVPLPGAKAQLCARLVGDELICLRPSEVDAEGVFLIEVPESAQCIEELTIRALSPEGGFASTYCALPLEGQGGREDPVLRNTEPLVLYQTRPFEAMTVDDRGEGSAEARFGELELSFVPDQLFIAAPEELRAREVPLDAPGLCFLDEEGPRLARLFAFAPDIDIFGGRAGFRLPNLDGHPPGHELALFALGNLDCSLEGGEKIEEGSWERFGRAQVDESGEWIEADRSTGLPCLSWFAVAAE